MGKNPNKHSQGGQQKQQAKQRAQVTALRGLPRRRLTRHDPQPDTGDAVSLAVVPSLYCESAGEGDLLLVVENSDTFDSLLTVLREQGDHRVGLADWGAGTGFKASVLSIARIDRAITEVKYFGDPDESGLRVPANAAALAAGVGLPLVRPAAGLYGVMFRRGTPQPGQRKLSAETAADLARWLGPDHHAQAAWPLVTGERLAQETVLPIPA